MRLKSIKLAGFKSFVDPTNVSFPSNLCAVVGPNGCGKSNIIDAVRWVMGESSAKNLRGEAMTDVIFNGSGGRKPVGQASIELVFDNSAGTLVGEYAGFTEISIRRKVTRESQNFYYLNGVKCRRRDITDIFLGTGLGPRSYAIIEQGMISRLIEAKPEELRVYIEEAAGISKYKERRRDTENRMRRTQENLERLTDIRDELERQLSRLERQAQSAEKYKEYKELERSFKAKLHAIRYQILEAESEIKRKSITELELTVEASVTEHVRLTSDIEKHRTEFTGLSDAFNAVQARFYAVGNDIARIEQSIQHAKEREAQIKRDLEDTRRHYEQAKEHLEIDQHKTEGWQAEILEIEPELDVLKDAEENSSETLLASEEAMQVWQQEWDQFNQRAAQPKQQAEVQQSKIQYLEQVQQRLLERIEKLRDEKESLVIEDDTEEILELEDKVESLERAVAEKTQALDALSVSTIEIREKQQELVKQKESLTANLLESKGRFASLEALQQAALDQQNNHVLSWLEDKQISHAPKLADSIVAETGWEVALETVLGDSLQGICISGSLESFEDSILDIEKGDLTLIENSDKALPENNASESLISKVKSDYDVSSIIGDIYIAESLKEALPKRAALQAHQSIITRDGIWVGHNWIKIAKADDANFGVIARKEALENLSNEIEELEANKVEISAQVDQAIRELDEAENERDLGRKTLTALSNEYSEVKSLAASKKAKVARLLENKERLEKEISESKAQLESEAENLIEARTLLQDAIAEMEKDTQEREALLASRDKTREQLEEVRQQARSDKDKSHAMAMRYQSVKTQLESIQQGIGRLQEQMQVMGERKASLEQSLEEIIDPDDNHQTELEAHLEKRLAVETELAEARGRVESVETEMKNAENARNKIDQVLTGFRSNLETARLEAKSIEVKREGLKQQLSEDNVDLFQIIESLNEEDTEKGFQEELERLGNKISRLGAINLAAIEEFKTESERKQYLDAQNDDLNEALETLEGAIRKIDRETRTRFKETFDQVNSGLQELFPKVFGGGHAYLELTGEDMLDTGIAIMARPPGKKNSTIHLLSGGEKALTAIALVFSIFRLNPAPFCMLDEVDAPLDDANVGRYARMVEEMSSQVQFIYITHNKIAMEMAHQLMGVTMHEPGVSRMVTVDVEEAAELAAI